MDKNEFVGVFSIIFISILIVNSLYIQFENTTPEGSELYTPEFSTPTQTYTVVPAPIQTQTYKPTIVPTVVPTPIPTVVVTLEHTQDVDQDLYFPPTQVYSKHLEKLEQFENGYEEDDHIDGKTPLSHRLLYNYDEQKVMYTVTYDEISDYFSEQDHYYYNDPREIYDKLFYNEIQDRYMSDLLSKIKREYGSDENRAEMIISLVQNIPYNDLNFNRDEYDWHYPYETLHYGGGVCSDKAILMSYLLWKMDFDVVIFEFDKEKHSVVGIRCDPEYDYMDTGYAYIETTHPTIPTRVSMVGSDYIIVSSQPRIVDVGDGYKKLNMKEYYYDSKEMDDILLHFGLGKNSLNLQFNIYTNDDRYQYDEYKRLIKKYHME